MSDDTLLDFDNIDELDMGGIEETPDYLNEIPNGVYVLQLTKAEKKQVKNKKSEENTFLTHTYSVQKVVELDDSSELEPMIGSLFTERWTTNQQGLSYWKKQARKLLGLETLQGFTFGDVLKALNNGDSPILFMAKCSTKTSNNDGKEYKNIQVRIMDKVSSVE